MSILNYWNNKNGSGKSSVCMTGHGYGKGEFIMGYPCGYTRQNNVLKIGYSSYMALSEDEGYGYEWMSYY